MPKRSLAECEEPSKDIKEQLCHPLPKELEKNGNFVPMTDSSLWEPITSEEPKPPKRKRKAGGCNLRKSIAWNAAFFTEEGVLDPDELSILTGPLSECDENFLARVKGEKTLLLTESYSINNDGCNLKLDENLFKELSTDSITKDNEHNSRHGVLECPPQHGHSCHKGSLAVHSIKNINKLVSQHGGCPRPPASSSQKKLTKINTPNATCKLPKFEAAKVNTFISAGPGSIIPKSCPSTPTVQIEAKIALKTTNKNTTDKLTTFISAGPGSAIPKSCRSTPTVQIEAKIALKTTNENTTDKLGCLTSSIRSFSNSSKDNLISQPHHKECTHIGMSNTGSKTYLEPKLQAVAHTKPSQLRMPSPSLGFFSQVYNQDSLCNSRTPSFMSNTGSKTNLEPKLQAVAHTKPSQLRMPSPSLGFFSQAKSAIPQSISLLKNNEQFNLPESHQPASRKHLNLSRMSASPKIRTQIAITTSSDASSSMSNNCVCSSKCSVPSEIRTASVSTPHFNMEARRLTKVEKKCQSDSSTLCNQAKFRVCTSSEKEDSILHAYSLPCGSVFSCKNGMDNTLLAETSELDSEPQKLLMVQELKGLSDSRSSFNQRAGKICYQSKKMDLTPNPDSLPCPSTSQNIGNELTSNALLTETEIFVPECSTTEDGVGHNWLKEIVSPSREKDASMPPVEEKLMGASKQGFACMKLNAAPFSDEWLAAIEAAGEDLLKMKTGAVQNSPPEKTLPEPGPWSPVKRNTNAGPFDCTKHTAHPTTTD